MNYGSDNHELGTMHTDWRMSMDVHVVTRATCGSSSLGFGFISFIFGVPQICEIAQ